MPNWCFNEYIFHGSKEDIKTLYDYVTYSTSKRTNEVLTKATTAAINDLRGKNKIFDDASLKVNTESHIKNIINNTYKLILTLKYFPETNKSLWSKDTSAKEKKLAKEYDDKIKDEIAYVTENFDKQTFTEDFRNCDKNNDNWYIELLIKTTKHNKFKYIDHQSFIVKQLIKEPSKYTFNLWYCNDKHMLKTEHLIDELIDETSENTKLQKVIQKAILKNLKPTNDPDLDHFIKNMTKTLYITTDYFGSVWLGYLTYALPTMKNPSKIRCRGYVENIEYDNDFPETLKINTDTAWSPQNDIWDIIIEDLGLDIVYSYRSTEPGNDIYRFCNCDEYEDYNDDEVNVDVDYDDNTDDLSDNEKEEEERINKILEDIFDDDKYYVIEKLNELFHTNYDQLDDFAEKLNEFNNKYNGRKSLYINTYRAV